MTSMNKAIDQLTITQSKKDNKTIHLVAEGRLGLNESNQLERQLDRTLLDNPEKVILNMKKIAFLSSVSIRVILSFYKKVTNKKIIFKIEDPSDPVINVLGMTNLDELLLK